MLDLLNGHNANIQNSTTVFSDPDKGSTLHAAVCGCPHNAFTQNVYSLARAATLNFRPADSDAFGAGMSTSHGVTNGLLKDNVPLRVIADTPVCFFALVRVQCES